MTESQLRIISRLAKTQDGKDFLNEVLRPELVNNHRDILKADGKIRNELCGVGNCLITLVTLFEDCDNKIISSLTTDSPEWA